MFSTTFVWSIYHSEEKWAKYDHKCANVVTCTILFSLQILISFEMYAQVFNRYSNIIFHEHQSGGSRVVPCGRTDGSTDVTELMVTFAPPSIFYIKSNEWQKINTTKTQTYIHSHTHTHTHTQTYTHKHTYTHKYSFTNVNAYKIKNLTARQSCSQPVVFELWSSSMTRLVTLGIWAEFQSQSPTTTKTTLCRPWTHQPSLQVVLRHLVSKAQINKGVHKYTH